MDPSRAFVGDLVGVMQFALIAGLLIRGRQRLCWSFFAYAVAVFAGDRLIRGWPSTFDTAWFWMLKESIYGWLKIVIVVEIGLLTFFRLARARRILAWMLLGVVATGLVAQFAPAAPEPGEAISWVSIVSARGQAGILCLFSALVVLAAHYQVPIHPFHRGILIGFALYLFVYTTALALLRESGEPAYRLFLALDPTAYAATVGLWAWSAWRTDPVPGPAARVLHPWAYS